MTNPYQIVTIRQSAFPPTGFLKLLLIGLLLVSGFFIGESSIARAQQHQDAFMDVDILAPLKGQANLKIDTSQQRLVRLPFLRWELKENLPHQEVRHGHWSVFKKKQGSSWAGTSGGFAVFDFKTPLAAQTALSTVFSSVNQEFIQRRDDLYNENQIKDFKKIATKRTQITALVFRRLKMKAGSWVQMNPGAGVQNHEFFSDHLHIYRDDGYWVSKRTKVVSGSPETGGTETIRKQLVKKFFRYRSKYGYAIRGQYILAAWVGINYTTMAPPPSYINIYEYTRPFPEDIWLKIASMLSKAHEGKKFADLNVAEIWLRVPESKHFHERTIRVYGPGKPGFKFARVFGTVIFDWWEKWDYVKSKPIKILLRFNNKTVRRMTGKTDRLGQYSFDLKVNKNGKRAVREFQKDFKIELIKLPDEYNSVIDDDPNKVLPDNLKKNIPTQKEWKDAFWKSASHLNAIMKDIGWQKSGRKGTPNVDQWQKNYNAGRHSANALKLLIDVATTPATAASQVLENAANTYFALTGKKLPFDKNSGMNALKYSGVSTLDLIEAKNKIIEGR